MNTNLTKLRRLDHWEEAVGVLEEITVQDDILLAQISRIPLALPIEMLENLRPYIGSRVSILRTDDKNRPYRWRLLDKN